jgi:hypothetical protein
MLKQSYIQTKCGNFVQILWGWGICQLGYDSNVYMKSSYKGIVPYKSAEIVPRRRLICSSRARLSKLVTE